MGDVITHVDGLDVNTAAEMVFRMSVAGLGHTARITRVRAGQPGTIDVAMIAAPDDPPRMPVVLEERDLLAGMVLSRINPAVIAELNLPLSVRGVVIADLGQFGRRIGARVGDIIVQVNGVDVATPRAAARELRRSGRRVALTVQRGGQRVSLRFRV